MPELPEVETLKLGIQKYVVGHKIHKVEHFHPKIFFGDPKDIEGAKIEKVRRVGKGLILELSNGNCLAIHIKMTGQLIYRDEKTKNEPLSPKVGKSLPGKYTHVIIRLDDRHSELGSESQKETPDLVRGDKKRFAYLYYNDMRRFGWFKVLKKEDVDELPFFKGMGPEPFGKLTYDVFRQIVLKRSTNIKLILMDQALIGGVGNIYANDALFKAGISPIRAGKSLSEKELKELYDSLLSVLKRGLDSKGASENSYVNILGQEGEYQNHTLVYGKKKELCPNKCGEVIKFMKLGGRGSYFCSNCQH